MRIVETTAAMLIAGAVLITSNAAQAYGHGTPDGQPPAEEQVCDNAGLYGAAYGLCVAFCEANDCDAQTTQPDDRSCSSLRKNYLKHTGQLFFPCEIDGGEEQE
jgi:hypothetical protein